MRTLDLYQSKAIQSKARELFLVSGRQSGKTFGAMAALYFRAELIMGWWASLGSATTPPPEDLRPEFFISAPTEKFLYSKTMSKFKEALPDGITFKYIEDKTFALTSNGIKFRMVPFSKPQNVESFSSYGGVVDEAGQGWDGIRDAFIARTKVRRSQVAEFFRNDPTNYVAQIVGFAIYPSHPYEYNWFYTDVWRPYMERGKVDSNVEIINWRVIDTPYHDKTEYEKAKREKSAEEFAMLYEGRYIKPTSLIYQFENEDVITDYIPDKFDEVIIGLDFGSAHPCAISVIGIVNGFYFILDEFKEKRIPVIVDDDSPEMSLEKKLVEYVNKYKVKKIYADSARPDLIEKLSTGRWLSDGSYKYGLPVVRAVKFSGAKQSGIWWIQGLLKQRKFKIAAKCRKHIDEMRNYRTIVRKNGDIQEEAEKRFDDLMDAMRYGIWTHKVSIKQTINTNEVVIIDKEKSQELWRLYHTPKTYFNAQKDYEYNNRNPTDSWFID